MAKVQVVEKSVRTVKIYHANQVVRPKLDVLEGRSGVNFLKLSASSRKAKEKNVRNFKRYPAERYISLTVHFLAFTLLSLIVINETSRYNKNPTGTTMEEDMYPVQEIDFPGIAICNINVLSQQKTNAFAEELWQMEEVKEIGNLSLEAMKSLMKYMGHLYTFENWENEVGDIMLLDEILSKVFTRNYNVLRIMEKLTPSCRSLLKRCHWQGQFRVCQELFVPRWTQDGYCCTFNYNRWNDKMNGEQISNLNFKFDNERSKVAGSEYGLWVFLDPQLDDYYYNLLPGKGFKILIYSASDYPDAPSGGLKEVLVSPRSQAYLVLKPTSFYSSPDVIQYDKKKRQCLFNTELNEIFGGYYSYSQCMMLCRIRDILQLCGCIPFFYPVPHSIGRVKTCNLEDLVCLQRNKYKWWSVEPIENENTDELYPREKNESESAHLRCDCFPSCENTDYNVFKTGSDVNHSESGSTIGCQHLNASNHHAVLSVSFGSSTGSVRLRQDVLYHWYDLMSNYGGLCCLFLGISIITPIEFIYLHYMKIFNWRRRKNVPQKLHLRAAGKSQMKDLPIYWNEMVVVK